ncbi:hypothetical protein NA56DRAFT_702247 [Hyaloscypha hepaticicola]|uniref:2EXR domain-containing protein n=1 Tax=Hyaloscypha hepaticicola TaxID=2082293 RepID=A0A2J6Q899_9HELO|nr:hypothetical protein NA56DRAFT_702247 [Hyaloscypha hepaticicola]
MSPKIILNTGRKPKTRQDTSKSQEKGSPKKSMTFDEGTENNDEEFRELMTPKVEATEANGPKVFHYFPNLPIEIRLKIWRLNSPEPCVVTQAQAVTGYNPLHTIMVSRPTPAALHACSESRNEFFCKNNAPVSLNEDRARYRPFFEDREGKKIFFSFEVDALHLMDMKVAEPLVRKELRYLVIGDELPRPNAKLADLMMPRSPVFYDHTDGRFGRPDYFKLRLFKKLEVLVVIEDNFICSSGPYNLEQNLKVVESMYPDFKRPKIIFQEFESDRICCNLNWEWDTDSSVY